jgi:hypothetical protein
MPVSSVGRDAILDLVSAFPAKVSTGGSRVHTFSRGIEKYGVPLQGKAQAAALIVPGTGQHSDPLERPGRKGDRLPSFHDRLDDGGRQEGQRQRAAYVRCVPVVLPCQVKD